MPTPFSRRQFGSDNFAGLAPEALAALVQANAGHAESYGNDAWTAEACRLVREVLETDAEVFFVFNGTAANSLALAAICQSYHSAFCHERSHAFVDECGCPEFTTGGARLIPLTGAAGRITPAGLDEGVRRRSDLHYHKPAAVTLTQSTEVGTAYSVAELGALCETAHRLGLKVHLDGARFANAVASLGVAPKEITWQAGVDVMSFGCTKNGVAVGEAVVFFDKGLARDFEYRAKQAGQLASKLRFLAAPWVGLLQDGAWLRHAAHANAMAQRLEQALAGLPGLQIAFPRQANALFLLLPEEAVAELHRRGWVFYQMHNAVEHRLMCSWDTTPEDVDALVADFRAVLPGGN
jgi:threonine aldolase